MIASLGGAIVKSDGSRNYPASGGMVGGLSFDGGNWSYWSGAGKSYNRFTPNSAIDAPLEIPNFPTTTTNGGGGSTTTSGGGSSSGGSANVPTTFNTPASPYRGLSQIRSGGNQLIGALNSIFGAYQSGSISYEQALLQAQQLSGYLNNPNVFYQARRGDDASLLVSLREQANSIVRAITSWFNPVSTNTQTNCVRDCEQNDSPTEIPVENNGGGLLDILRSFVPSPRTAIEAPPNLFQFTPETNNNNGGNNNMRNLVIIAALAGVAYWLYTKYA